MTSSDTALTSLGISPDASLGIHPAPGSSAGFVLTADQQRVVDAVQTSTPGEVVVLQGYAGTGKSEVATSLIESGHYENIFMVAPTGAALNVLKRKLRARLNQSVGNNPEPTISFKTLHSVSRKSFDRVVFSKTPKADKVDHKNSARISHNDTSEVDSLFNLWEVSHKVNLRQYFWGSDDSDDYDFSSENFKVLLEETGIYGSLQFDSVLLAAKDICTNLIEADVDLMVVDEYSMVTNNDHKLLMDVARLLSYRHHDMKILLCGDPGQLPPVNPQKHGGVNDVMKLTTKSRPSVPVFQLTEVHRSAGELAKFGQATREIDSLYALTQQYGQYMSFVAGSVSDLCTRPPVDADIVLTFTNRDVWVLNKQIRAARGFGKFVSAGDRLVATAAVRGFSKKTQQSETLVAKNEMFNVAEVLGPTSERFKKIDDRVKSRCNELDSVTHDDYREYLKRLDIEFDDWDWDDEDDDSDTEEFEAGFKTWASHCSSKSRELSRAWKNLQNSFRNCEALPAVLSPLQAGSIVNAADLLTAVVPAKPLTEKFLDTKNFHDYQTLEMWRERWRKIHDWTKTVRSFADLSAVDLDLQPVNTEAAFAVTLHKAQGSEFDHVVYIVSESQLQFQARNNGMDDNRIFRPLYTAVTRAKKDVRVWLAQR